MQGVIKSYDPGTGDGVLIDETDLREIDLAENALEDRSSGCCVRANG